MNTPGKKAQRREARSKAAQERDALAAARTVRPLRTGLAVTAILLALPAALYPAPPSEPEDVLLLEPHPEPHPRRDEDEPPR